MPCINLPRPKAIFLDVEGTTTSIRFWPSVLVPFVTAELGNCLRNWWLRPETRDTVQFMRECSLAEWYAGHQSLPLIEDADRPLEDIIASVEKNVRYQLKAKQNNDPLKALVLLVWLYGCKSGTLKGHVYEDVAKALRLWKLAGVRVFTFASGSSLAQQLLLRNTICGNLRPFVETSFEVTSMGRKTDAKSYLNLASAISESRINCLFISDCVKELKAAQYAGFRPILIVRSHNTKLLEKEECQQFAHINSLEEIVFA